MVNSQLLVFLLSLVQCSALFAQQSNSDFPYKNPDLPIAQRVDDLISRMTLEEKVSQLGHTADAVPRLGIPEYNWWNEGLHGVARAGNATVFPQAIGMAATFDESLMHRIGNVISTEFRAKYYHDQHPDGSTDWYRGLSIWSPNINIFRDPRWGRGQETYGEDPFLTSRIAVGYIQGQQSKDVASSVKHFAANNQEFERGTISAVVARMERGRARAARLPKRCRPDSC